MEFPDSIDKGINIYGGFGTVGMLDIVLNRYSGYYKEDFYPAFGKSIPKFIKAGVVWNTANNENQITWMYEYGAETFDVTSTKIGITAFEINELQNTTIPYYKIQKEYDNEVSYYPNAPEENYGQPLPIVYGQYIEYGNSGGANSFYQTFRLANAICVDRNLLRFVIASHNCVDIESPLAEYELYKSLPKFDSYVFIREGTVDVSLLHFFNL
jgi:hypothetical protein